MPRKQRIEYPGAIYHIISRGNYRKDLFTHEKTAKAFGRTIFEAAERCGWKLYAYVIMSNHYHLAIETPDPNMVEGMRWLQSTFATRFNRFRNVWSAGSFRKFSYFPGSSPICYRLR